MAQALVHKMLHVAITEEFNGTSWSTSTSLATAGDGHAGFASQDSAVVAGGYAAPANLNSTQEYSVTYIKTVSLSS